ncbi:MAG TPA: oligosaccharide flippase family protein [Longimicrobium sp.]|nr:oligosaccharide flippase family protein [Longimicrobium sp.]
MRRRAVLSAGTPADPAPGRAPRAGVRALAGGVLRLARGSVTSGYVYLVASVFVVQGLAYLSQLVVAGLVGPAQFGIVRNVEAVVSLLLLAGCVGMPTLVLREAAATPAEARAALLRRVLVVCVVGGALAAASALLLRGAVVPGAGPYLAWLAWTVVLSGTSRTLANWFLGLRRTREAALLSVVTAAVSLAAVAGLTGALGLRGWVAGRFAGEALGAAALLWALRHTLREGGGGGGAAPGYGALVPHGAMLALGLMARAAVDHGGVLALGVWHAPRDVVGYFGIGTLVVTALMVFPGALGNLLVPRFAARAGDPGLRRDFARTMRLALLAVVPATAAAALLSGPAVSMLFPGYREAVPLLLVLLLGLPARTAQSLSGALLLAFNRNHWALGFNCAMLAASWLLFLWAVPRHGAVGAAWVMAGVEFLGVALFATGAVLTLRGAGATTREPAAAGGGSSS